MLELQNYFSNRAIQHAKDDRFFNYVKYLYISRTYTRIFSIFSNRLKE